MAVPYYGDFPVNHTGVVIPFNTFDSNDPSASVTMTDFANTDVHIHKNGSLTQRASSSGVAIDIDVDGITGNHWITIDLSDNDDAGFYAAGSEISVRIEGTTVDGATVNAFVGAFSIERAGGILALLKNGSYGLDQLVRSTTPANTLDVSATGEAGLDFDNIKNATGAHTLTNITVPTVTTVGTCTTNSDMVSEPPTATAIVDEWETQSQADPTGFHVNVKEVNDTAQTANDNGADINAILTDTNELQTDDYPTLIAALPTAAEIKTAIEAAGSHLALIKAQTDLVTAARMGALTDWIDGGRLDLILDAILLDTGTTIPGTITTAQNDLDIITGATGVNLLAATQASIDAIEADTNELQTDDYPTLIAALPTAAEIKTAIEAAGSDLDYLVKALVNKAIWTEADGALEMFNDADVSLGSIAGQITTDGTFTTRKRTVI